MHASEPSLKLGRGKRCIRNDARPIAGPPFRGPPKTAGGGHCVLPPGVYGRAGPFMNEATWVRADEEVGWARRLPNRLPRGTADEPRRRNWRTFAEAP